MNYRLQLSPISGSRQSQIDVASHERRQGQQGNWEDAEFFRSWLDYDSDAEPNRKRGTNWNLVLGLALAVAVSAAFWVGAGVLFARIWK